MRIVCLAAAFFVFSAAAAYSGPPGLPQLHPHLTAQQQAMLRGYGGKATCEPDQAVAASAYGTQMGSSGDDSLVTYPATVTNEGHAWKGGTTFIAPCAGVYSFSISFNTDSFYPCPVEIGTQDDVIVYFVKSTAPLYDDTQVAGSGWGAWRGELSNSPVHQGQAAYTVDLKLNARDAIQTMVYSNDSRLRCLWSANFSGHLVHQ